MRSFLKQDHTVYHGAMLTFKTACPVGQVAGKPTCPDQQFT